MMPSRPTINHKKHQASAYRSPRPDTGLDRYGTHSCHAEMYANLRCGASRQQVKVGILYIAPNFPCHQRQRSRFLLQGIEKVVLSSPILRVRRKALMETTSRSKPETQPEKVRSFLFGNFAVQIPHIFSKGAGKNEYGAARRVVFRDRNQRAEPTMLEVVSVYLQNEIWALAPIVGRINLHERTPHSTPNAESV